MPTILLVDDDPMVREYCNHVLADIANLRVLQADSSDQAIDIACRHSGPIELLISDVCMAGAIDGLHLAERLTVLRPELRVLLMSGSGSEGLALKTSWGFLGKPFRLADLVSRTEALLGFPVALPAAW